MNLKRKLEFLEEVSDAVSKYLVPDVVWFELSSMQDRRGWEEICGTFCGVVFPLIDEFTVALHARINETRERLGMPPYVFPSRDRQGVLPLLPTHSRAPERHRLEIVDGEILKLEGIIRELEHWTNFRHVRGLMDKSPEYLDGELLGTFERAYLAYSEFLADLDDKVVEVKRHLEALSQYLRRYVY